MEFGHRTQHDEQCHHRYTHQDESRGAIDTLFPFVDILDGSGTTYTSFGSEPFTPNNELRYNTFQAQDNCTVFAWSHSLTFGGAVESTTPRTSSSRAKESHMSTTRSPISTRTRTAICKPEPNGVAGFASPIPGPLHEHSRPGQADPAARRLLHQRIRTG